MILPDSDLHGLFVDLRLFFDMRDQVLMLKDDAFELPSAHNLASVDQLRNHNVH